MTKEARLKEKHKQKLGVRRACDVAKAQGGEKRVRLEVSWAKPGRPRTWPIRGQGVRGSAAQFYLS